MIVSTSEQVALAPVDLERAAEVSSPASIDEWREHEERDYHRHEARVTSQPESDSALYLTEAEVGVEKFRSDQLRDERGQFMNEGGAATVAAARAAGWRPTREPGEFARPGVAHQDERLHVHADGSWYQTGGFGDLGEHTLPTVARGEDARALARQSGLEPEVVPAPARDLIGARSLSQKDVEPSAEAIRWLEEVEQDPDVRRAIEVTRTGTPTSQIYADANGVYEPKRAALHQRIAEEMLKPGAARQPGQQKTAILMIGPSGAGKTMTLERVLRKPEQFSVISVDYARERLPGYDGYNSALLHEESTVVADKVAFGLALERNHNLVLDATGKTSSKYEQMVEKLNRLGYNVQALHVDAPTEVAARRAVARFKGMKAEGRPPRWSDPRRILFDTDAKPTQTYANLKAKGLLSRAMEFSTDGPPGSPPRKVEDIDYTKRRVTGPLPVAATKRAGQAGRAPGGGHPGDAGSGAGAERAAEVERIVRRVLAEDRAVGPGVAKLRRVRKTVVRGADHRISEVIEEELE